VFDNIDKAELEFLKSIAENEDDDFTKDQQDAAVVILDALPEGPNDPEDGDAEEFEDELRTKLEDAKKDKKIKGEDTPLQQLDKKQTNRLVMIVAKTKDERLAVWQKLAELENPFAVEQVEAIEKIQKMKFTEPPVPVGEPITPPSTLELETPPRKITPPQQIDARQESMARRQYSAWKDHGLRQQAIMVNN
jgi:hypothetical protein